MSRDTFHKAIELAEANEATITIGGGEPTLHPLFREFIMHAVWELAAQSKSIGMPAVFLVTNGTDEKTSIILAQLAERGTLGCRLSQDQYHDQSMVSERVRAAFRKPNREFGVPTYRDEYDCRDINGSIAYVQAMGRAKSWGNRSMIDGCCGGVFCTPRGNLYACECKKARLGTVSEPMKLVSEHFSGGYCSESSGYQTEILHIQKQETVTTDDGQTIKL